jgi:acyl carrier protein
MDANVQQLKDWILKRHPQREDIPGDLDLIENRLIDSLTFVEFAYLLEQVSGHTIDFDNINVDDFRCLDNIANRYLTPAP